MEGKFQKICALLKSNSFHYLDTWVRECVEHFLSDELEVSDSQLWDQVKEQWLLSDLRETAVPAFPPNLKDQSKITLPGKYVAQVETMVDSGRSRYSQFQDLQKDTWQNVRATKRIGDDEPPEKRCLTMHITDGVQLLYAMEYEVIPALKLNHQDLLPGFKMLITGPVMCRNGMLMLSPRNVTVLGGEVNTLVETNSYQALLMGTLGITSPPIANNVPALPPPTQDSGQIPSRTSPLRNTYQSANNRPPSRAPPTQRPSANNFQSSRPDSGYPETRSFQSNLDGFMDDDDDFLMAVPLDYEQMAPRSQQPARDIPSTIHSSELDGFDDMFDDDFDLAEIPDAPVVNNSLKRQPSTSSLDYGSNRGSGQSDFKRPCNNVDDIDVNPFRDHDWNHNPFRDEEEEDDNPFRNPKPSTSKTAHIVPRINIKPTKPPRPRKPYFPSNRDPSQSSSAVPSRQTNKGPKKKKQEAVQEESPSTQFKAPQSKGPNSSTTNQSTLSKYLVPSQPEAMQVVQEPRLVGAEPFVYLHQICTKELKCDTVYKVKAFILTLKGKIAVEGDSYSLLAKICDGSYSIDVNFSTDILETLLGFSPSEMIAMMKEKHRNSAVAERLTNGFKLTQQKLISLNCIFVVQFFKDKSIPRVLALEDITIGHLASLRQRQI